MITSRLYEIIGNWFGDEKPPEDVSDDGLDFESGPFMDCAISWVQTFKKLLIPREYRNSIGKMKCASICQGKKPKCKT